MLLILTLFYIAIGFGAYAEIKYFDTKNRLKEYEIIFVSVVWPCILGILLICITELIHTKLEAEEKENADSSE